MATAAMIWIQACDVQWSQVHSPTHVSWKIHDSARNGPTTYSDHHDANGVSAYSTNRPCAESVSPLTANAYDAGVTGVFTALDMPVTVDPQNHPRAPPSSKI